MFKQMTLAMCLIALIFFASCKREQRSFHVQPNSASRTAAESESDLYPAKSNMPALYAPKNDYEENAYAMSEGKRLYESFNCVGCHAHGGGAIGPPLMDEKWIYGSRPDQIFASIIEGRPNGMPSFRGKIADNQVWEIVAYVRSLSGQVPQDAAPARDDDMQVKPAENSMPKVHPTNSSTPPSVERPE